MKEYEKVFHGMEEMGEEAYRASIQATFNTFMLENERINMTMIGCDKGSHLMLITGDHCSSPVQVILDILPMLAIMAETDCDTPDY